MVHSWAPGTPPHPPSYSSYSSYSSLTIMSQPQRLPVCTLNSPLYLPGTIFSLLYLANSYSSFYPSLNIIFSGKNFMRNPQEKRAISLSLFWEHRVLATGSPGKSHLSFISGHSTGSTHTVNFIIPLDLCPCCPFFSEAKLAYPYSHNQGLLIY